MPTLRFAVWPKEHNSGSHDTMENKTSQQFCLKTTQSLQALVRNLLVKSSRDVESNFEYMFKKY